MFSTQPGVRSSPPREPTTTHVFPSWYGDVSITVRTSPVLRPVVVSSTTGMPATCQPKRPPVKAMAARWSAFMLLSEKSVGMGEIIPHPEVVRFVH